MPYTLIRKISNVFIEHLQIGEQNSYCVPFQFLRSYYTTFEHGASKKNRCDKRSLLAARNGLLKSLENFEKCLCDDVIRDAFHFEIALNEVFSQEGNEFHNKMKCNKEKYALCVKFAKAIAETATIISTSNSGRMLSPQMRQDGELKRFLVRMLARYYKAFGASYEGAICHRIDNKPNGAVFAGPFVDFVDDIFKELPEERPCGEILQDELAKAFKKKF